MKPSVSVIIPTWNRSDLAISCLESLGRQTCRGVETILVDDGSTDGTAERIQQAFPETQVIVLPRNRGFAAAVNTGIRAAQGKWIFLLNNDVTLAPDAIEKLVQAAEAADAAMAAPLILWHDTPEIVYSAGDCIHANGRPESIGFRRARAGFTLPDRIFGVSAAAGLYRHTVFDTVGWLDESFTAYFEDSDLCFRARLAGFGAILVPEAVAWHIGSATISGRTWWRSMLCFRNHALLVIKNMPGPLLIRYLPIIFAERLHQARMLVSSARTEFGLLRAVWLLAYACAALARRVPRAVLARRRIQRRRRIPMEELRRWLEGNPSP